MTNIAPEMIALQLVKQLVPLLEQQEQVAADFNTLPNIPWWLRERVRTIEGKLGKITLDCIDLVDRLGTDEAEAYLEEQWPE